MNHLQATAALILALLASPAIAEEKPTARATRVEPVQPASPTYRLTTEDIVNITVFGEPELAVTTRIGKDGAINLPMSGLVRIEGQNIRDAAKTIETALREYLVKPQVTLTIVQYSKRRITVLGQVNRPGNLELPSEESVNITEAIGMAGGYTRIASKEITVKRTVNGQEKTFKLNAKTMGEEGSSERFKILPGDTITVGERLF
jgi:polysaccharide export outer membrane protein